MKRYIIYTAGLILMVAFIAQASRQSAYPVDDNILSRRSSRALSAELITERELMTLFEAARWAPSSYNDQPWKFLYAWRGSDSWQKFFDLLVPFNQQWAKNASVLILVVSRTSREANGAPAPTHSFDAGAATQNIALQGNAMRLVVHAMSGFDADRAREVLEIPQDYAIDAMIAIGKPGDPAELPDFLRSAEKLSERKPLTDIIHEGAWQKSAGVDA